MWCWQRRSRMQAIREAAGCQAPIWGLRVIRDFEKLNGVTFNPRSHMIYVRGMGEHRYTISRMRQIFGMPRFQI